MTHRQCMEVPPEHRYQLVLTQVVCRIAIGRSIPVGSHRGRLPGRAWVPDGTRPPNPLGFLCVGGLTVFYPSLHVYRARAYPRRSGVRKGSGWQPTQHVPPYSVFPATRPPARPKRANLQSRADRHKLCPRSRVRCRTHGSARTACPPQRAPLTGVRSSRRLRRRSRRAPCESILRSGSCPLSLSLCPSLGSVRCAGIGRSCGRIIVVALGVLLGATLLRLS